MSESDLDDSIIVLTGGTSGIGREAARTLAGRGATVGVIGRDHNAGESLEVEAAEATPGAVNYHRTDLAVHDGVRGLANELAAAYERIDVLAHNAGLLTADRRETTGGIEQTFAVNHLAPYLLTHQLFDTLRASRPTRIVVTASEYHRNANFDLEDLNMEASYRGMQAYARSKFANVAFTLELADRLPEGMTAHCFHPGFVPGTRLYRHAPFRYRLAIRLSRLIPGVGTSRRRGAEMLVDLVSDPTYVERNGLYVTPGGEKDPAEAAMDPALREELWERSAAMLDVDPDWP